MTAMQLNLKDMNIDRVALKPMAGTDRIREIRLNSTD